MQFRRAKATNLLRHSTKKKKYTIKIKKNRRSSFLTRRFSAQVLSAILPAVRAYSLKLYILRQYGNTVAVVCVFFSRTLHRIIIFHFVVAPLPPSPLFSFFLPVGVYTLANTFTRYECLSFFHLFLTSLNCNHLAACHTTVSLFSLFHLSFCSLRLVPLFFLHPHFHSSSLSLFLSLILLLSLSSFSLFLRFNVSFFCLA